MTPQERFAAKVRPGDGCWEWTAFRNPSGYGMFRYGGRMHLSHRLALVFAGLETVESLTGREVDHFCRNRGCVNPNHLRVVTRKQNCENKPSRSRGVREVSPGRWRARVKHNGKTIHVGYFTSEKFAVAAARAERLRLFTHNEADRRPA